MALDINTFDAGLKDYYSGDRVESVTYKDRPFYALVTKDEKFPGRRMPIPIIYGNNQAVGATFSKAQARGASTSMLINAFELTRVNYYGFAQITNEVMHSSEGDEGAWFEARVGEINSNLDAMADRVAFQLYRSGWGELGTIATSGVSGSTIQLTNPSDVHGVEVGQVHCFSTALSSAVLRASGGTLTVSGVNKSTGLITYSAAVSTLTGGTGTPTDGDWIFIDGDRQNSATPVALCISGLSGWCPTAAPTNALWFGVDRTTNSLLGGIQLDGTSLAPEDAIINAGATMSSFGHKATHAFVSFPQYAKICRAQRLLQRFEDKVTATVSFEGVIINSAKGPIKVIPDQFCPNVAAYVVDLPMIKLCSYKKAVRVVDDDGLVALRLSGSAGIEVRTEFSGNLGVKGPSGVCHVALTAA